MALLSAILSRLHAMGFLVGLCCMVGFKVFHFTPVNNNPPVAVKDEVTMMNMTLLVSSSPSPSSSGVFCINSSRDPFCCSPDHCERVQRSTIYSECCHNLPTKPTTPPPIQTAPGPFKGKPIRKAEPRVIPILVSATPRSGTVFLQSLLRKLGVSANNDAQPVRAGTQAMISWIHIFLQNDDRYYGSAYLNGSKFRHVWHQVRDPLKSLTSIAFTEPIQGDKDPTYFKYIDKHISLTPNGPLMRQQIQQQQHTKNNFNKETLQERFLIHRGLEFYLQWQRNLLSLSLPRFSLEDLTVHHNYTVIHDMFRVLKRKPPSDQRIDALVHKMRRRRHLRQTLQQQRRRSLQQKHTNSRKHRSTLQWEELCLVSKNMTRQFLQLSQVYGYYRELEPATVCDSDV
ncbi:expressed unknown protein [Seminavis robusta]|uniref:Sulfotransferase domain-containing protein n=1 Tax=Seminavis robusta TaxID=568900 RepID=A0A9N8E1E8_9STRA|nr:expressed unknown protein [Seminavis robusta]|eukprot:Sro437_g142770.1 n/a (399) ;mRNA; r:11909-13105